MRRLALIATLGLVSQAWADIAYSVSPEPENQAIRVSITFDAKGDTTKLHIPAWCPGFYTLKAYEKDVFDFKATLSDGKPLTVQNPEARTWSLQGTKGKVTVSYRVKGDDPGLGFFGVNVRKNSTFINGPAAFMYLDGRKTEKCLLDVKLPEGWKVATGMDSTGPTTFKSGDYDELIDHPLQLGEFKVQKFSVEGIPFEAVYASIDGKYPNLEESANELQALSEPAIRMFGGAPFKRYVYIIHLAIGDFGGGLEHRASCVIAMPNVNPFRLGTLAAHEFFHAWNVKQIRPKVLGPFDYTQKVRTANLWFAEGVTDYYAQLHTYEAGVYSDADLIQALNGQIAEYQRSRTRLSKTLEDVCRTTWEDSGFGAGDLSYYTAGLVAGFVFDAAIRDATDGKKSLDDVIRLLYQRHRLPKPGYDEDQLRTAINEVAMADLTPLYHRMLRSTDGFPFEPLNAIGLRYGTVGASGRPTLHRIPEPSARQSRLLEGWLRLDQPRMSHKVAETSPGLISRIAPDGCVRCRWGAS